MGFRFRRRIKILPGVRVNISKSGISTTIGGRGASVNLKGGKVARATVGLPGTGVSYTAHARSSKGRRSTRAGAEQDMNNRPMSFLELVIAKAIYFGLGVLMLILGAYAGELTGGFVSGLFLVVVVVSVLLVSGVYVWALIAVHRVKTQKRN